MCSSSLSPVVVVVALVAGCAAAVPRAAAGAARAWQRPVDGAVVRAFAVGRDRFAAGQHRGVDLAAPPGARVRAACGGRVSFAGTVPRGGRTLSVRCGPLTATYQHLGSIIVRRGQPVVAGAAIAVAGGGAGRRAPVHLGARISATGAYVDPLALIGARPPRLPPPAPAARRRPGSRRPGRWARRPALRAPAPLRVPLAAPRAVPADGAAPPVRLPWPVWLGVGLVALGLPVGGLVRARSRRRAARVDVVAPRVA